MPLLLLDSDVEGNPDHYRDVTDRLYGGNTEHRLRQEILLGVGGVRALRVLRRGSPALRSPRCSTPTRATPGFLGLERIRELTVERGRPELDFDTALEVCRASTVFTTHTPVPAGIDRFPRELVEQYFGDDRRRPPGVPVERILALGTEDYAGGDPTVFNMAVMGFRLAQRANGVSQLHGHVSREMFHGLWPAFDEAEVPITSITNGVHAPTWVGREVFDLAAAQGADRRRRRRRLRPGTASTRCPARDIWAVKRAAARAAGRGRPPPADESWTKRGAAKRRAGLDRRGARPRRADDRLRAARRRRTSG